MATNICSRKRSNFVKPSKIAEQYDISKAQIYKMLSLPVFADAIVKIGDKGIRVDQDKFYEIREQYYR